MWPGVEKTVGYCEECKWFRSGSSAWQYLCSCSSEGYSLQIGVKVRMKFEVYGMWRSQLSYWLGWGSIAIDSILMSSMLGDDPNSRQLHAVSKVDGHGCMWQYFPATRSYVDSGDIWTEEKFLILSLVGKQRQKAEEILKTYGIKHYTFN
jgi:hypothetical protein